MEESTSLSELTNVTHQFDGSSLTLAKLAELSIGPTHCDLTPSAWRRIEDARAIVEAEITRGTPIYGATTGVGALKGAKVDPASIANFYQRLLTSEAIGIPGPAYAPAVVRAAIVVLINNFAAGRTGVRPLLVKALLGLLARTELPVVPAGTSFGTADLCALSRLALALVGPEAPESERIQLAAKEAVSLIDNNSFGLAHAGLALVEAQRIAAAFDAVAALSLEGFRANLSAHGEAAARGTRQRGQARSRRHLSAMLEGSALWQPGVARNLHDPLVFRSITQTNGALREALGWACAQIEEAINESADNPLVDFEGRVLVTSSSMVITLPTLALDALRQAFARAAQQSCERLVKLQSAQFSGLPSGLAPDDDPHGGLNNLNVSHVASAQLAGLLDAASPVLLHSVPQVAEGIEDVASHLPLAAAKTQQTCAMAWTLLACEAIVAVWAIDRRRIDSSTLGGGVRALYDDIRPLLPIGLEGLHAFDVSQTCDVLRSSRVLDELMSA